MHYTRGVRYRGNGVPVVSLITDFGLQDHFAGVMKGVILTIHPQAHIVDICHDINPHDIPQAAYVLSASYSYFPRGTLHVVVVDPGVGSSRKALLIKTKNYFFIGPDNGVFTLALQQEPPSKIIEITNERFFLRPVSDTFHGRDIFAPTAAWVSKGEKIEHFGREISSLETLHLPSPSRTPGKITGEIISIDRFGNLITNIDRDTLRAFSRDARYTIAIKGKTINRVSKHYAEVPYLDLAAFIGSSNHLEIALNGGSAQDALRARKGNKVEVIRL